MKKIVATLLLMMFLVTSCGKVPQLSDGKDAVITLKDGGISVDDLYNEMKSKYALSVLINMTDEKILSEKYKDNSADEKTYIDGQVQQVQMYYDYYYKQQYSSLEALIQAQYGVNTIAELKEIFSLDYKRNQEVEAYAKTKVTEKDVNNYYKDKTIGDIKASHILITADYNDNATEEEKAAAEKKALDTANSIIKKLQAGEDFAKLAKEYSKDGSAKDGGDLGWFNRGDMVTEFEDAAIKLEKGKYTTTPVKTKYGYHIILKVDQKEKPKLEEVKDSIIETLAEEKVNNDEKISYEALIQMRKDAGMTIEDKDLQKQYENYVYNTTSK